MQSPVFGVVAEKQGAEVRSAAGGIRPTGDDELLPVEAFGLEPQAAVGWHVRLIDSLGHDAFNASFACMLAKARATAQHVVREARPADLTGEQGSQPFLALEQGQPGSVLTVQEQEAEGHEHQGIGAALVHGGLQAAERRNTIGTKGAQLAIEIGRLHGQRLKAPLR